jgi:hypothetical protein
MSKVSIRVRKTYTAKIEEVYWLKIPKKIYDEYMKNNPEATIEDAAELIEGSYLTRSYIDEVDYIEEHEASYNLE